MKIQYIKYHTMVRTLIEELKLICDDYVGRKIDENTLRYYIQLWAVECPELLFGNDDGYNPTLKQRVGSKRLRLITKMIEGMQLRL